MSKHDKMQNRLKTAIQEAIFKTGKVDGTNDTYLTNTDVVEALLDVAGLWASLHGFKGYTRLDLVFKHAETLLQHIEKYEPIMKSGKMPFDIIPHTKIN